MLSCLDHKKEYPSYNNKKLNQVKSAEKQSKHNKHKRQALEQKASLTVKLFVLEQLNLEIKK